MPFQSVIFCKGKPPNWAKYPVPIWCFSYLVWPTWLRSGCKWGRWEWFWGWLEGMKTLLQKGHRNCNCKHGSGAAEGPSLQMYISFWSQIAMKRYCIMVVTAKVDRGQHPHCHSIAHLFGPKDGLKVPFRHRWCVFEVSECFTNVRLWLLLPKSAAAWTEWPTKSTNAQVEIGKKVSSEAGSSKHLKF